MDREGPPLDTSSPLVQSLSSLLQSLSAILKHSGIDKNSLIELLAHCYEEAEVPATPQQYEPSSDLAAKHFLGEMLRVWWSDPAYLDDMAEPITLPKTGPRPSLQDLHEQSRKTYSRPVDLVTLDESITYLILARSIKQQDGQCIPLSRYFMMTSSELSNSNALIQYAASCLRTAAHNAFAKPGEGHFQREAYSSRLPIEKLPYIRSLLDDQGMTFLEQIDSVMEDSAPTQAGTSGTTASVTVGIYLSVEDNEPSENS